MLPTYDNSNTKSDLSGAVHHKPHCGSDLVTVDASRASAGSSKSLREESGRLSSIKSSTESTALTATHGIYKNLWKSARKRALSVGLTDTRGL